MSAVREEPRPPYGTERACEWCARRGVHVAATDGVLCGPCARRCDKLAREVLEEDPPLPPVIRWAAVVLVAVALVVTCSRFAGLEAMR